MTQGRKRSQKWVYIAAFVLLAGGLGYLVAGGLKQNSVYFLNVSEALAQGTESIGRARLFGKVKPEGLQQKNDQIGVTFLLADKDTPEEAIMVRYAGAVPDSFKPGVEVIVEGSMASAGSLFQAETLMTKCPSKYEKRKD